MHLWQLQLHAEEMNAKISHPLRCERSTMYTYILHEPAWVKNNELIIDLEHKMYKQELSTGQWWVLNIAWDSYGALACNRYKQF